MDDQNQPVNPMPDNGGAPAPQDPGVSPQPPVEPTGDGGAPTAPAEGPAMPPTEDGGAPTPPAPAA